MKRNRFLVAVCMFFLLVTAAYSGEAAGEGQIKEKLLRPGGWLVEWRGNSSGVLEFIFEERGENIMVKIHNAAWNMKCERNATVVEKTVKLDGCSDTGITLRYDSDDEEYPFKGESQNVNYKLKAK